jgi:hypothetical protein
MQYRAEARVIYRSKVASSMNIRIHALHCRKHRGCILLGVWKRFQ